MQDPVEEIKARLSIVDFVSEYMQLKKAGRNFKATCPFHAEKTPSFMVNPDLGIFKCFGCGEGGDVFAFLMKKEHLSFKEALERLAQKTGVILSHQTISRRQLDRKDQALQFNQKVAQLYQRALHQPIGQAAYTYVLQRTLTEETIEQYQLGFAPLQWDFLTRHLKRADQLELAVELGLVIKQNNRYYDRFRGRIMFPIFNNQGGIIGFSGRLLDSLFSPSELAKAGGKYINSPQSFVFDKSRSLYGIHRAKSAILEHKKTILVEGNVDTLLLHQHGILNAVAPLGTALTVFHLQLIKKWTDTVLLAFDGDHAGATATKRAIELCGNLDLTSWVVVVPSGYDVARWLQEKKTWAALLKNQQEGPWFYIITQAVQFDTQTAAGKKSVAEITFRLLKQFPNEITINYFLRKTAHYFDIPEATLLAEWKKVKKATQPISIPQGGSKQESYYAEKICIKLLSENLQLAPRVSQIISVEDFSHPLCREIISLILSEANSAVFDLRSLIEQGNQEVKTFWEELLLDEKNSATHHFKNVSSELLKLARHLKEKSMQTQLNQLQKQLAHESNTQKASQIMKTMLSLKKVFEHDKKEF